MSENPASNLIGPAVGLPCEMVEGDLLLVRRVGLPGAAASTVAISAVVKEPDFDLEGEVDLDEKYFSTIILTPMNARRLIAVLLAVVDEVDGNFTELLPWDFEEDE